MQDQNLGFNDPEEQAVIEAIRRRHPRDRAFAIARTIPGVKDGHVAVIDVIQNGQKVAENYAFIDNFSRVQSTFLSIDDLLEWSAQQSRPSDVVPAPESIFIRLFNTVNAAATIAILITLTICVSVYIDVARNTRVEIPEVLSNALATILGFYFGSRVQKLESERQTGQSDTPKRE